MNKKTEHMDEALGGTGQQSVRSWVQSIPEDVPSMAWRSELNEKLLAMATQNAKKSWQSLVWRPALGLVMAGALAAILLIHPNSAATPKESSLEAHLLEQYRVERASAELVNYSSSEMSVNTLPKFESEVSEADLESL
ncbi:MAG: hypothetical protein ACOYON_07330 [Fimbriimonas sp.]